MSDGPDITLEEIRDRKIRRETIRNLIALLCRKTQNAKRIGRRVLVLDFALNRFDRDAKGKEFADTLKVSEARVSIGVSEALDEVEKLLKG